MDQMTDEDIGIYQSALERSHTYTTVRTIGDGILLEVGGVPCIVRINSDQSRAANGQVSISVIAGTEMAIWPVTAPDIARMKGRGVKPERPNRR